MKVWSEDHPKAGLMARKRAAILAAAQDTFLRVGYEGASMEAIAKAAGVSIMTLYRHAKRKEELFEAVILNACDYSAEDHAADSEAMFQRTLPEVLTQVGELFLARMTQAESVALMRAVMVETVRFQHLSEAAFRGFVGGWQDNLDAFLAQRAELNGVTPRTRRLLAERFFDALIGTHVLRALLGLPAQDTGYNRERVNDATQKFMAWLSKNGGSGQLPV